MDGFFITSLRGCKSYYDFVAADPTAEISYYSDHLAVFAKFKAAPGNLISPSLNLSGPAYLPNPYPEVRDSLATFSLMLEKRLQTHVTRTLFFFFSCGLIFLLSSELELSDPLHSIFMFLGSIIFLLSLLATIFKYRELSATRAFVRSLSTL